MDLVLKSNLQEPTGKNVSFSSDHTDHYEVLNIAKDASKSQIREAYIRLKNTFSSHSQALYSLISDEESQLMLNRIEEAFRILNDDLTKREYDAKIGVNETATFSETRQTLDAFKGKPQSGTNSFSNSLEYETTQQSSTVEHQEFKPRFNSVVATRSICAENVDHESVKLKMQEVIAVFEMHDGELYRKLREIAGVSEEEMQERTKVSLQYIRAIEQNAFEKLPSLVFVKGFLRSYLKYLKVQEVDAMVKAFAIRFENWSLTQEKS